MIILPMAGLSQRFAKAGYALPKYMLILGEESLFSQVLRSFEHYFATETFLFICRDVQDTKSFIERECLHLGIVDMRIVVLEKPTQGQAETVALGLRQAKVPGYTPITIFNIDTIRRDFRFPDDDTMHSVDGFLEVFKAEGDAWSFAKTVSDTDMTVVETTEKRRISDLCSTGLYHFAHASDFVSAFDEKSQTSPDQWEAKELYIAPLYNKLIGQGKHIIAVNAPVEKVIACGIPDEYEALKKKIAKQNPLLHSAVLMTGQLRTYRQTAKSIVKHMVVPNAADLFYFGPEVTELTYEDSLYSQKMNVGRQVECSLQTDVYEGHLKNYCQHKISQDFFKDQSEACVDRSEWIAGVNPQRIFSFFYNIQHGVKMLIQYEKDHNLQYNNIIITRPDIAVYTDVIANCLPKEYQISDGLGLNTSLYPNQGGAIVFPYKNALTGELISPGTRFNDQIIVLHRKDLHVLTTIYDDLTEQLKRKLPANSETLLWHTLSGIGKLKTIIKPEWIYEIFREDSKPIISFNDTLPVKKQIVAKAKAGQFDSANAVSVIFQGSVDHLHHNDEYTNFLDCVKFLRENNPEIEIIISTYKGSHIGKVEFVVDKVVLSADPGHLPALKRDGKINNVNRLITSSQAGVKHATHDIIVKTRTDCLFYMKDIAKFYNNLDHKRTKKESAFFEKKIVVSPYFTIDPSSQEGFLFHISDWIQVGTKSDLQKYWDMPLYTINDSYYYNKFSYKKGSSKKEKLFISRYAAEQYLTMQGFKNFGCDIPLEYHNHKTPALERQFWDVLFNNFIILEHSTLGLVILKYAHVMKFFIIKSLIISQETFDEYYQQYIKNGICKPPIKMRSFRFSLLLGNAWEAVFRRPSH